MRITLAEHQAYFESAEIPPSLPFYKGRNLSVASATFPANLVPNRRPPAEADYVDRVKGVLFAAQRLARPITPEARNRITKIAPKVYSAIMTIPLLEQ